MRQGGVESDYQCVELIFNNFEAPEEGCTPGRSALWAQGAATLSFLFPCATRLPPKATSEKMGSCITGRVIRLLENTKKLSSTVPKLWMTCVGLCNLVLKENLNKIIFNCFFLLYRRYRAFIFSLTFLLYASFHLSRKPISIVKVREVVALFKHPPAPVRQGCCHFQYFLLWKAGLNFNLKCLQEERLTELARNDICYINFSETTPRILHAVLGFGLETAVPTLNSCELI